MKQYSNLITIFPHRHIIWELNWSRLCLATSQKIKLIIHTKRSVREFQCLSHQIRIILSIDGAETKTCISRAVNAAVPPPKKPQCRGTWEIFAKTKKSGFSKGQ